MFKRSMTRPRGGRIGNVYAAPRDLVIAFSDSWLPMDQEKVTKYFAFTRGSAHVGIYDYKRTNLYAKGLPHPKTFWSGNEVAQFSLGGHIDPLLIPVFQEWLREQGVDLAVVRLDSEEERVPQEPDGLGQSAVASI